MNVNPENDIRPAKDDHEMPVTLKKLNAQAYDNFFSSSALECSLLEIVRTLTGASLEFNSVEEATQLGLLQTIDDVLRLEKNKLQNINIIVNVISSLIE